MFGRRNVKPFCIPPQQKLTDGQPCSVFVKKVNMSQRSVVKVRLTNKGSMVVNVGSTEEMVKYASWFAKHHSLKLE